MYADDEGYDYIYGDLDPWDPDQQQNEEDDHYPCYDPDYVGVDEDDDWWDEYEDDEFPF